ncbi:hypothetical protein [uncultured Brachyspira sp.]|uniref:hypothetical protein n=1 Tax=uncultured Brachyspira sp. TaxID=221953 RepID=UPI0027DC4A05|nr:hypothetical protein [uncultured Brachyspira sp.]
MLKKVFILIIIFLSFSYILFSDNISSKHSLSILNSTSARNRGIMDSGFLTGKDSSVIFINSSSLMSLIRDSINLNYTLSPNFKDEYLFNGSYSHTDNVYAIGIGLASEINKIKTYNNLEIRDKDIYNGNYLINIGVAYMINENSFFGANIKVVINNFDKENIFGGFLDLSYMQSIFNPSFKIGVGIKNFGFYDKVFAAIDTDIITSIAYAKEDSSFAVSLEYDISVPSISHRVAIGLEAMIINFNKLGLFNSNIDYDDLPESALDEPNAMQKRHLTKLPSGILGRLGVGNKGISLGLSLYVDLFRLDYAIVFDNFNKNNISHDFGLSFMF